MEEGKGEQQVKKNNEEKIAPCPGASKLCGTDSGQDSRMEMVGVGRR